MQTPLSEYDTDKVNTKSSRSLEGQFVLDLEAHHNHVTVHFFIILPQISWGISATFTRVLRVRSQGVDETLGLNITCFSHSKSVELLIFRSLQSLARSMNTSR